MDKYYKKDMSMQEKLYLAQVPDEDCFEKVIDIYKKDKKEGGVFIDTVKRVRSELPPWSTSINKTSLSKKDITLYSEDQLIEIDRYLFDFGDIDYLLYIKKNPYTDNPLPVSFLKKLESLQTDWRYFIRIYPLDIALQGLIDPEMWCPDVRFNKDGRKDVVYLSSPLVPFDFSKKIKNVYVSLFYDKRPWNENYIYKITLNNPIKQNIPYPYETINIDAKNIKSVELIHNPTEFSPPYEGKPAMRLNREMIEAIVGYHNRMDGKSRYIRPNMIDMFKKYKFHEQHPMKLYRGLQISGSKFFNDLDKVKVGDIIHLPSKQVSSWTTNRCVAEKYSMFSSNQGIVVSSVIDPSDMILDSRFIHQDDYFKYNKKDNNTLFWQYQNEILVKPGDYPLKVESVLYRPNISPSPYTRFTNEQYRSDLEEGWDQYTKATKTKARKQPAAKKSVARKQPVSKKSAVRKQPATKKSVLRKQPVAKKSVVRKQPLKKSDREKITTQQQLEKDIKVIGSVFKAKGQEGDFDWQIRSGLYEDSLFIYNDDEMRRKWKRAGQGNAVIRKYNRYALPERPRSVGICTGNGKENKGYTSLDEHTKSVIDDCISEVIEIVNKYGYKKIYYSAKEPDGLLGTSIFQVDDDVLQYITKKIRSLERK